MKFLADQDVYAVTARLLESWGHDVVRAAAIGLARAADAHLLDVAQQQERILITRDRDFGALVFLERRRSGVIYLRIPPKALVEGHAQLRRVLHTHTEDELRTAFVVVEPDKYRFRHPPR